MLQTPSTHRQPPPNVKPAPAAAVVPAALPSLASRLQQQLLPVVVDAPGEIEGGWPKPEAVGLLVGRCKLGTPPQGWRREDIVAAVMKVSFDDWQGGMPLVSSRQLGEYKRQASAPGTEAGHGVAVYQRDDIDGLTGRNHPATLAVEGQRASAGSPRHASLQSDGVVIDSTESVETGPGAVRFETYQTRKLLRREYHAGVFEICLALNAQTLQRLRERGQLVFFTGADDPTYPLALRRATLSVTYGERRMPENEVEADAQVLGGLASMAGRWRLPDGSST
ncbi:hypothetical protein [Aquabacterium sp.]|uniref:hypothetical protein n=1 Tax=Aquabacterium sp. TaxID=1872578 RepID=UPI002C355C55|nr:hypothetical protein [Aquabacterium sp.]HSW04159.1 hypothetical protein [Aquabacterium sp.]